MTAKKTPARKAATKQATSAAAQKAGTLSAEERAALKERTQELKAQARKEDGTKAVLAKIAEMSEPDRQLAESIHAIVTEHAPDLTPKTYYGMPAYARDGKTVCFFQPAEKFGARYATLGFDDTAALDDGNMWPTAYALTKLTKTVESEIAALVKRAVGTDR